MPRVALVGLAALLTSAFASGIPITAASAQTLTFEEQCLDLDSGEVEDSCRDLPPAKSSWDVLVTCNADKAVKAVILQNRSNGVAIAHLEGTTFDEVTADDITEATFTRDVIDQPFDGAGVILIRTERGAVFKLGNAHEHEAELDFDYELLLRSSS